MAFSVSGDDMSVMCTRLVAVHTLSNRWTDKIASGCVRIGP